jgi:hypothetical protein
MVWAATLAPRASVQARAASVVARFIGTILLNIDIAFT